MADRKNKDKRGFTKMNPLAQILQGLQGGGPRGPGGPPGGMPPPGAMMAPPGMPPGAMAPPGGSVRPGARDQAAMLVVQAVDMLEEAAMLYGDTSEEASRLAKAAQDATLVITQSAGPAPGPTGNYMGGQFQTNPGFEGP